MEPIRFKILYKTETPMLIASELLLLLPSNILISLEFAEFCTLAKKCDGAECIYNWKRIRP